MKLLGPCVIAFFSCAAFTVTFHLPPKHMVVGCLGGALGWFIYLVMPFQNDFLKYFLAAVTITAFSEVMARVCKVPVTIFLTPSLLPMVPGAGMYYTMQYCLQRNDVLFMSTAFHTLALAGALVLGIMTITSLVRMWKVLITPDRFFGDKVERENY